MIAGELCPNRLDTSVMSMPSASWSDARVPLSPLAVATVISPMGSRSRSTVHVPTGSP